MMKTQSRYLLWLTTALFVTGSLSFNSTMATQPDNKDSTRKILLSWDGVSAWGSILAGKSSERKASEPVAQFSKRILEELIDEESAAHVDAIVYCLFTAFWSDLPSSKITDLFPWRPAGMDEAGIDMLKVLIDRCHHHNMQFIADIRMNDRHGVPPNGIAKDHPEWALFGGAYDYALDPVRQAMLDFNQEVLDGYEVDGLEYDYMRWCHMFKPGEGKKNAHLLTEFTRKTRKQLDEAAKRRGCDRLLLGVRVPQSIVECDYLGFDLKTWIKEGLVDYIVPSDFMHTDTNMKTDIFVKLAKGTNCKIYPAIHPRISQDGPNEHHRQMKLENFRAAAQNFYGYGADGVSPYNYNIRPAALEWLRELRDLEEINSHDRHYLFYAVWKKPRTSPTSFSNDDNIYLDRAKPILQGSRRFRMAEDFSDPKLRTTIKFKALGLTEGESLTIRTNGAEVPSEYITRVFDENGQSVFEGDPLPPFHLYVIDMNWETTGRKQPLVYGDNRLSVRLIPSQRDNVPVSFRFVDMVLGVQADDPGGVSSVDLNGYLDDFAIWSRTLSVGEIKAIYDSGQQGIGIKSSKPSSTAAGKLDTGLRVLYEFENADELGANSASGGRPAAQVGPDGALVSVETKAPKIGKGAADFTQNDATLKVDVRDVEHLFPGPGGAMTVSCWLKATSQAANHTVWGMSNLLIPSPIYSSNRAHAMFATQTIIMADPQQVALGMVRPGSGGNAHSQAKVTDGKWHHIAVTINQGAKTADVAAQLFIDGKAAEKLTIAGQPGGGSPSGTVSIEELECFVHVRK